MLIAAAAMSVISFLGPVDSFSTYIQIKIKIIKKAENSINDYHMMHYTFKGKFQFTTLASGTNMYHKVKKYVNSYQID